MENKATATEVVAIMPAAETITTEAEIVVADVVV